MAGSKPGERRGGRQKGTPNKATIERQDRIERDAAAIAEAVRSGVDLAGIPRAVDVMRIAMAIHVDRGSIDKAAAWAKEIAPYETPKLSAIEHGGPGGGPVQIEAIRRVIVDPRNPDA